MQALCSDGIGRLPDEATRDGDKLFVKPGTNPEVALFERSETRFQDPRV